MSAPADFVFNLVPNHADAMPIETAIKLCSAALGLPDLGGPSGRGWSYWQTYERCPHLFNRLWELRTLVDSAGARLPDYLETGIMYHTFKALEMAERMNNQAIANRGIYETEIKTFKAVKQGATERLAKMILRMCKSAMDANQPALAPDASVVYDAARLWQAHKDRYEDDPVTPLAVEWLAEHPENYNDGRDDGPLYSCRYDLIAKLGEGHPLINSHPMMVPGAVVVFEHKTARWLNESTLDGWPLEGEILGELWLWEISGARARFGELAGVIVDVVTKTKTPNFHRMLVPAGARPVSRFEKWIRYKAAAIQMARIHGVWPQQFRGCNDKYGACALFRECEQLAWEGT